MNTAAKIFYVLLGLADVAALIMICLAHVDMMVMRSAPRPWDISGTFATAFAVIICAQMVIMFFLWRIMAFHPMTAVRDTTAWLWSLWFLFLTLHVPLYVSMVVNEKIKSADPISWAAALHNATFSNPQGLVILILVWPIPAIMAMQFYRRKIKEI